MKKTMKSPLISIITPSYNQGAFIAETIESVISQAGDFNLEYIIMDGGSTDNSVEIIKGYAERLQQGSWPVCCRSITFHWSSETDKGQTDALAKGFAKATGDIFAWLNSDDTYLPGALQRVTDYFNSHPETALLYGDAHYIDTESRVISRYQTDEFDLLRLASSNIICQPAAFFRSNAFRAVGGLNEQLNFVMDYDLWIRLGKHGHCTYLPELLATYRLHEASKTINSSFLIKNSKESLAITVYHFGWAPLTRIFTLCSIRTEAMIPTFLSRNRIIVAMVNVVCTIVCSIWLNKGVNRLDFNLINGKNFRKILKKRVDIMTQQ